MIKTKPSSFRNFHLNASKVTTNPINISISRTKEQTDPAESVSIVPEFFTMRKISQGSVFLKSKLDMVS